MQPSAIHRRKAWKIWKSNISRFFRFFAWGGQGGGSKVILGKNRFFPSDTADLEFSCNFRELINWGRAYCEGVVICHKDTEIWLLEVVLSNFGVLFDSAPKLLQ